MRRLIFSARARQDLLSIREQIARDRPVAAVRMIERLAGACERLTDFPDVGRAGLVSGTRELVTVQPYIVVYTVSEHAVEILHVAHAAQDR
ncbi:MAG: type II toxin-antitoxin system RelE/ParE family toxin [Pseudomonadota bacterium]|nr:type II toxin-antitoxin system RelE/ParE family toxin [Pseudomonadota bacterium]